MKHTTKATGSDTPQQKQLSSLHPMSRPAFGKSGRRVRFEANFFRLHISPGLRVYQYAVEIQRLQLPASQRLAHIQDQKEEVCTASPERVWTNIAAGANKEYLENIFKLACEKYAAQVGDYIAYDGRSIAYSSRPIAAADSEEGLEVSVTRLGVSPSEEERLSGKFETVIVVLKNARTLSFDDISRPSVHGTDGAYMSVLDVVLGMQPKKTNIAHGRSFYSPTSSVKLGRDNQVMSAWPGFYQSARLTSSGTLLNVDQSYSAFWDYQGEPLISLIRSSNAGYDLDVDYRGYTDKVEALLSGVAVRAVHNNVTYRVFGFSHEAGSDIYFNFDGEEISIPTYFERQYNVTLNFPYMPCVRVKKDKAVYVPVEQLIVAESQRVCKALSADQTASMVRVASTKPGDRKRFATKKMQVLNHSGSRQCQEFGLKVDMNLSKIDGRVLPAPPVVYKNGTKQPQNGRWNMEKALFHTPARLRTWVVLNDTRNKHEEFAPFFNALVAVMRGRGIIVDMPRPPVLHVGHDHIGEVMQQACIKSKQDTGRDVDMMLIMRGSFDAHVYNEIKYTADIDLGIVSQVVMARNAIRMDSAFVENLLLKIHAKLGGCNSRVGPYPANTVPNVPFRNTPHIILGADVSHPGKGSDLPSIAALVGSRDREGIQYAASISYQDARQEVMTNVGKMFKEVYAQWLANFQYKVHTQSIIMFRDGVSEGQYEQVIETEVEALRQACREYHPNLAPKITYIIVTKRHHARFFPSPDCADFKSKNIVPGTVVDSDVTSRDYYDFLLNSHVGLLGTNKPCKYTVLLDENNIPVDALQGYVYQQTHSNARCTRSVSMPTSAHYAHLLAFRGRAYLDTSGSTQSPKIHPRLAGKLFFV